MLSGHPGLYVLDKLMMGEKVLQKVLGILVGLD